MFAFAHLTVVKIDSGYKFRTYFKLLLFFEAGPYYAAHGNLALVT